MGIIYLVAKIQLIIEIFHRKAYFFTKGFVFAILFF